MNFCNECHECEQKPSFAIHIASCLVQPERAVFLKRVLQTFLKQFPCHFIVVGFDIAGLTHAHGKELRYLFETHSQHLIAFEHSNGLGYSWNHAWTFHDYDVVLQTEDDWLFPTLDVIKASRIAARLQFSSTDHPSVVAIAAPARNGAVWEPEVNSDPSTISMLVTTYTTTNAVPYLVNNHPHFETRAYRALVGPFPENVAPPEVENTYHQRVNVLRDQITVLSANVFEHHIGEISANHPCAWANFMLDATFVKRSTVKTMEFTEALNSFTTSFPDKIVFVKKEGETIYHALRQRSNDVVPVLFPSAYSTEVHRFQKGADFFARFFSSLLLVVAKDNETTNSEAKPTVNEVLASIERKETSFELQDIIEKKTMILCYLKRTRQPE